MDLIQCEALLYLGRTIMVAAAFIGASSIIVFTITGRKLKKKLKAEYGEPRRYALK